jgi:hypothetical protein
MKRVIPITILVILAVLVVAVALLPTAISTPAGRRLVLDTVNRHVDGTVALDGWKLGWVKGIMLDHLSVTHVPSGLRATVKTVSTPAGLLGFIGGVKHIGAVRVVEPHIVLAQATAPAEPPAQVPPPAVEPAPASPPPAADPAGQPTDQPKALSALGFDVKGSIEIKSGRMEIAGPDVAAPLVVQDVNVAVSVDSLNSPITFGVSAAQPAAAAGGAPAGRVSLDGQITPLHDGKFDPAQLTGTFKARIEELDLAAAGALALSKTGSVPSVSGRLNATLDGAIKGARDMSAEGSVQLTGLQLSGGPLGEDHPALDRVSLDLKAALVDGGIAIDRFRLDSPLATAKATGTLRKEAGRQTPQGSLKAEAVVNVAAVAAQFPHTLKLREGMTVEKGEIVLDAAVTSAADALNGALSLQTRDIAARVNDRAVTLDKPIDLSVKGGWTPAGPDIESAVLTSSFAEMSGKGTLKAFHLNLAADLDAAMAEAAKFADMGDFSMSGRLNATADLTEAGKSQEDVALDATITNLSVRSKQWRIQDPNLAIKARLRVDLPKDALEMKRVSLQGGSLGAECTGTISGLTHTQRLDGAASAMATGETLSGLLGVVHPLLSGCAAVSGRVDATLRDCRLPFDDTFTKATSMHGAFGLKDVVLAPAGIMAKILGMAKLKSDRLVVPDQNLEFACTDGRVRTDPLTVKPGEYELAFDGTVGLDGTLDYRAQVPLTESMVGAKAYPFLKDKRLNVPIAGKVDAPRLDSAAFVKAAGELARDAARDVLIDQGSKFLERLKKGKQDL